jgi:hypothetical protein
MLDGAKVADQHCESFQPDSNSGLWLGLAVGELALAGRDKLTFIVSEPIDSFGVWAEQLVAESTGKEGRGVLPVADEPVRSPDKYGDDRIFIYIRNADSPNEEQDRWAKALGEYGHPVITVSADGPEDLGRLFFFSEFAVGVIGWVLGINPFDQPNVEEAKQNGRAALEAGGLDILDATEEDLKALITGMEPPNYFAIMGYLPYDAETDAAIGRLRTAVGEATKVATTFGYGPRFLHSTGQLHKGGPATGVFLQLVHDGRSDLEIPGEDYSFRQVINAQADGDFQTLKSHELPIVRVRLSSADLPGSIDSLTAKIKSMF